MEVKNKGQGKIFNNSILEKLTRGHAFVPITMHFLISVSLLVYCFTAHEISVLNITAYFISGILSWSLFEYLAHRYIFHMNTDTKFREKVQYTFHGIHHEYPRDTDRIVMPPVPSFIIGVVIIATFRLVFGIIGFSIVAGFLTGYASYALIHYTIHTRIPPKNFMGKLWMHHSFHHYKNDEQAYGVSTLIWDYIFGTMPKSYRQ